MVELLTKSEVRSMSCHTKCHSMWSMMLGNVRTRQAVLGSANQCYSCQQIQIQLICIAPFFKYASSMQGSDSDMQGYLFWLRGSPWLCSAPPITKTIVLWKTIHSTRMPKDICPQDHQAKLISVENVKALEKTTKICVISVPSLPDSRLLITSWRLFT